MCFVDIFCYKMGLNVCSKVAMAQCAKQQRKDRAITHERYPDFRHGKKIEQKRGEFKYFPQIKIINMSMRCNEK